MNAIAELAIGAASMSDLDDDDRLEPIIDLVNDTIVRDAQTPVILGALKLLAATWSRRVSQRQQFLFNFFVERRRNSVEFFAPLRMLTT
jgi:hypothetical protein